MKTILLMCWAMLLSLTHVFAQDDALSLAFADSYKREKSGDYTGAINAIKAVYAADSYEINLRLGWLTYYVGSFTDAVAYYQKAIGLRPMSIEAKLGYASPAAALGNWGDVTRQYEEVLRIDPQNSTANYRMGLIHYNRKEYDKAKVYLEKVVNLYPFDYMSTLYLAWTHLQLGKNTEAKALFKKVLLMSPGDTSAKEGLALIK